MKTGLDDFLAAGHGVDDLLALASPILKASSVSADDDEDVETQPSQRS
ncbi:MAG TPA: hypothetical protein VFW40_02050 [Capsulimonadaceae bacterium]|nr:hypothetical protein [Capsulimonadaceae bacterium]